jgi:multidrug transporter EmrE-like cation transporter
MKQMILLLVTVTFNVMGQYLMKRGMSDVGAITGDLSQLFSSLATAFTNPYVLAGVGAYGMSSIFWLILLSRVDLSYAYPALSLGYVMVTLVSALLLGEQVSALRWAGVLVICVGVILVARS